MEYLGLLKNYPGLLMEYLGLLMEYLGLLMEYLGLFDGISQTFSYFGLLSLVFHLPTRRLKSSYFCLSSSVFYLPSSVVFCHPYFIFCFPAYVADFLTYFVAGSSDLHPDVGPIIFWRVLSSISINYIYRVSIFYRSSKICLLSIFTRYLYYVGFL